MRDKRKFRVCKAKPAAETTMEPTSTELGPRVVVGAVPDAGVHERATWLYRKCFDNSGARNFQSKVPTSTSILQSTSLTSLLTPPPKQTQRYPTLAFRQHCVKPVAYTLCWR